MNIDEKIAVMRAYKDGKKIEVAVWGKQDTWQVVDEPQWNFWGDTYRVAKEPREYWMTMFHSMDNPCPTAFKSEEDARKSAGLGRIVVHMKEVL